MITYTITGKTRKHKKFETFVEDVIDYLLPYPYKREIHIDIEFVDELEGNCGECFGDRNFAEIAICKKDINKNFLDPRTIALTAAHELVHAKQYIKGQIKRDKWNSLNDFHHSAYVKFRESDLEKADVTHKFIR